MQLKTFLLLMALMAFMVSSLEARATAPTVPSGTPALAQESLKTKSFREWKSEKVQSALGKVTETRTRIQLAKSKDPNMARRNGAFEAGAGINIEGLQDQLQQDQATLEIAKDLSVTDYFVGYLTKIQDKKAAFSEVAGKLTAEEVAELMAAYANSVFGTNAVELSPSATSMSVDRFK